MDAELKKCIEICVGALNGRAGEDDDLPVLQTFERLSEEPYRGRGLGIGDTGAHDYRDSWEDMLARFVDKKRQASSGPVREDPYGIARELFADPQNRIRSGLTWKDALLMLFDWANLTEVEMLESAQSIENAIYYNHVLKHILENLVRLNDIPTAREYTLLFRPTHIFKDSDNRYQGYRIIARHYADLGDADNFFKLFKLCEPREERNEMARLKSLLVRGVCRKDGLDAAVRLCAHKNIGDKFYYHALDVFAEDGEYAKLKEIFAAHPELRQPEEETELNILVKALLTARDRGLETPDDFEELFRRADAVNTKLKWGDVKLRDSILLDLGLAYREDKEQRTRCRKAIRHNWLKRELADRPKG